MSTARRDMSVYEHSLQSFKNSRRQHLVTGWQENLKNPICKQITQKNPGKQFVSLQSNPMDCFLFDIQLIIYLNCNVI